MKTEERKSEQKNTFSYLCDTVDLSHFPSKQSLLQARKFESILSPRMEAIS